MFARETNVFRERESMIRKQREKVRKKFQIIKKNFYFVSGSFHDCKTSSHFWYADVFRSRSNDEQDNEPAEFQSKEKVQVHLCTCNL